MEIKEIRAITGLTQRQFAEKYHIPFGTYQKWEAPKESINHRECPTYVKELLERVVREDFQSKDESRNALAKKKTAHTL